MPALFESVQTNFSSAPRNGVYGTRKIVKITNGKGHSIKQMLDKSGKVKTQTRRALTSSNIKKIMRNKFVPNLWTCHSCQTRKNRRI